LAVSADGDAKIENPGISLNSVEPSVIPPRNGNDSTPAEIFIRPAIKYLLTVMDRGYIADSVQLIATRDTVLTISLKKSADNVPVDKGDHNNTTVTKQGYWWIPAVLFVLVLFAFGWKILSRKKKETLADEPVKPGGAGL